jgi:hypothetical protein
MENRRVRIPIIVIVMLVLATAACLCDPTSLLRQLESQGGGTGRYGGLDGYDTVLDDTLSYNEARSATLNSLTEAHNWDFSGNAGDVVTIRVNGQGDCDPQIKLIDPSGNIVTRDDDSGGGYNALITTTLSSSGTYTVRVDVFTGGTYDIIVEK